MAFTDIYDKKKKYKSVSYDDKEMPPCLYVLFISMERRGSVGLSVQQYN